MNNQDQSFLDDVRRNDPAYRVTREFLAAQGINFDTLQPMMPRAANFDPKDMEKLGVPLPLPPGHDQYSEPAGPPSIFNEHGQPVGSGGLYRRAANTVARGVGHVARRLAGPFAFGNEQVLQQAYETGEGLTRSILTQAVPAALEQPQRLMSFKEDIDRKMNLDLAQVVRQMGQEAGKRGDAEGAAVFEKSAAELEATLEDPRGSEVAERIVNSIVNQPATEGEQAMRDMLAVAGAFFATKRVSPVAGQQMTRAMQYVEAAARGYAADKVTSDPRRDSAVEGILEMFAPSVAQGVRNYISTGDTKELQELNKRLGRRELEGVFGLVVGGGFDLVLGMAKHMRLSRLADDWVSSRAAAPEPTPDKAAETATFLSHLEEVVHDPGLRAELEQLKTAPFEQQIQRIDEMMEGVNDVSQLGAHLNEQTDFASKMSGGAGEAEEVGGGLDEGMGDIASLQDQARSQGTAKRVMKEREDFIESLQRGTAMERDVTFEQGAGLDEGMAEIGAMQEEMIRLTDDELFQIEELTANPRGDGDRPLAASITKGNEELQAKVEQVAQQPMHEQYPEVARALNLPVEQSAVEIALSMNPFPASKVMDEAGQNMALFHGGTKAFDQMSDEFLGTGAGTNRYGKGHHFSDAELAGEYASKGEGGNIRKAYLDIQNPIDMDAPVSDEMMQVLEAEGRAMDVDPDDAMKDVYDRWVQDLTDEQGMEIGAAKDYITKKFEEAGFDGLTYKFGDMGEGKDHNVWVAFHDTQVANAFGGLEGAVQQLARVMEQPAAKSAPKAGRKPRGQGAGMRQAILSVERLEKGESSVESALKAGKQKGHQNEQKAAEMLMNVLRMKNSPILQSVANHPEIQRILGPSAMAVVMTWALSNPWFMKAIEADNERDDA